MPWYRNGHSVPVIYKGEESGLWWVDYSFENEQEGYDTWEEALEFALTTHHAEPERQE